MKILVAVASHLSTELEILKLPGIKAGIATMHVCALTAQIAIAV